MVGGLGLKLGGLMVIHFRYRYHLRGLREGQGD